MTYEERLRLLAAEDPRIVVMTAENRVAIRNLPPILGDRFIDVGIAEQTMVGAAAGLALRGRIPVVHALAAFLTLRAFEFVRTDVGIGNLPVKLVGGVPGFLSEANGPTHQAIEDISLMRGIPPMQVFCPADEEELVEALPALVADPGPVYIRYNASRPAVKHTEPFAIGKAETLAEGTDVAILTCGFLLGEAEKARRILEAGGVSTRLINLRMPKPADEECILKAARETSLLVTVEDHFMTGGLFSIVGEILQRNDVLAGMLPIALRDRWFRPGLLADVLSYEGFTGEQIAESIMQEWKTD
ncbi:MAG: transketolase C-terminal domain-containing protein [Bacteroidota bacterium]